MACNGAHDDYPTNALGVPFQRSPVALQRQHEQLQFRQQQLLPQAGLAATPREPVVIAGLGWFCGVCLHPTRKLLADHSATKIPVY